MAVIYEQIALAAPSEDVGPVSGLRQLVYAGLGDDTDRQSLFEGPEREVLGRMFEHDGVIAAPNVQWIFQDQARREGDAAGADMGGDLERRGCPINSSAKSLKRF